MSFKKLAVHPPHFIDELDYRSAFIPFCEFGLNMSSMGQTSESFSMPVCNSFRPVIFYDQLCYQIDADKLNVQGLARESNLQLGLTFLIDTNSNRQFRRIEQEEEIQNQARQDKDSSASDDISRYFSYR